MAQYDIGGGKKIKIPDNLDPETRLQLAEVVKDKYNIDINQTTVLEQVGRICKSNTKRCCWFSFRCSYRYCWFI